ncbi:VOC family protein [Georgenia sp.]
MTYPSGSGSLFVYPSAYAGTNRATAAFFAVPADAFDAEVATLREKGIEFQTFELPSGSWSDGVLTDGPMRAVWFADPDGNILNVVTM